LVTAVRLFCFIDRANYLIDFYFEMDSSADQVSMIMVSSTGGVFCLGTRTPGLARLVDVGQAPETWSSHA
jgi:hypothetical protein